MKGTILEILLEKYNKVTLTKQELADELGFSLRTIDNMMKDRVILPKPLKIGFAKNSPVRFNIIDIAEFIADAIEFGEEEGSAKEGVK